MAAGISLLCKCSFPHKQRGVQNSRVERVESIVRCAPVHVCVCVCVLSIARSHLGKVLCMCAWHSLLKLSDCIATSYSPVH